MKTILMAFSFLLTGCVGLPENVKPVEHFNADKYSGKWYEIASAHPLATEAGMFKLKQGDVIAFLSTDAPLAAVIPGVPAAQEKLVF